MLFHGASGNLEPMSLQPLLDRRNTWRLYVREYSDSPNLAVQCFLHPLRYACGVDMQEYESVAKCQNRHVGCGSRHDRQAEAVLIEAYRRFQVTHVKQVALELHGAPRFHCCL